MTLKSLCEICVIFFFTGIRVRSGDFIIRPEGENLLKVDLKNIINPATPSSDLNETSPSNIHTLFSKQVMRIFKLIR